MRNFRHRIEPILETNSYTLDMPSRLRAPRRVRGGISVSICGDVNNGHRLEEVDLLTAL
jgi:hypothetical protein